MSGASPAIEVKDLGVRIGERVLLEGASFEVARGEVVLLVGISGSGKSVTLKLLNGLLDRDRGPFEVGGEIRILGEAPPEGARKHAGIVFQDFGLFDEWNARENVLFGHDHGGGRGKRGEVADALLSEFSLEGRLRPTALSGGMKQRLALARVLAQDPEIVFYDEPTSGLDPAMSSRVAARIRKSNDEHGKTSVVVTHDLESLSGIADRVILLDPNEKGFLELDPDRAAEVMAGLEPTADGGESTSKRGGLLPAIGEFFGATGRSLEAGLRSLFALLPRWPKASWGLRYLFYYLRLTTLSSALVYVGICGFILGLIVTWFTFSFLPFKAYTEPLLIDNVIGAIGFSLFRIMSPGMVAMLVAARSGAAIAADVGNRVYTRQTESMRSLGVNPDRYLLTNVLWAQLLGMPLLCAVNFLAAQFASLVVFAAIKTEYSTHFWASEFPRFLTGDGFLWQGLDWFALKTLLAAFGVGAIATFLGMRPKESGRDVATAVTRSIIWGTLFVLLVQTVIALMEFEPL